MKNLKRNLKWAIGILFALVCVVLSGGIGAEASVCSAVEASGTFDIDLAPGESRHYSVRIKTTNFSGYITSIIGTASDKEISVSNIKITDNKGEVPSSSYGWNIEYNLEFDLVAGDYLKIGYYTIDFVGYGINYLVDPSAIDSFDLYTVTVYNGAELNPIELVLEKVTYEQDKVNPDSSFNLLVNVKNAGEMQALTAYIALDFGDSGIIPDYSVEKVKIGTVNPGTIVPLKLPVKVLKNAAGGFYCITAKITCKDKNGAEVGPFTQNFYITVNDPTANPTPTPTPAVLKPVLEMSTDDNYKRMVPGTKDSIEIKIKNTGKGTAEQIKLSVTGLDASIGLTKGFTNDSINAGTLKAGEETTVTIPVRVSEEFGTGLYEIGIKADYEYEKNNEGEKNMTIYIKGPSADPTPTPSPSPTPTPVIPMPVLELTTRENYKRLTPSTEDTFTVTIKNTGKNKADKIRLYVSGLDAAIGLTKGFTSDYIEVGSLKKGDKASVDIPLKVAKNFASGLYEIGIKVTYAYGKELEGETNMTVYVNGPEEPVTPTPTPEPDMIRNSVNISNVSQEPANPKAGEQVTVYFLLNNDGNADITNVKAYGTNLSSSGFEPVSSDPYTNVGSISAGSSKSVSLSFLVGEDINPGFNTLTIGYDFTDANKQVNSETGTCYILNVENEKKTEKKISKPKLIVSTFSTDAEILKAGDCFNFTFAIKNTHASKSAKNIKLTLSQAEGVYAPTEGTNIFYIDEIAAGEESVQTINLKTRSDVATGDYAISLLVEYEYDDMSEIDEEKGGVSEENLIKLRAVENYRPVIENIYIDSWNGITVGQPVDLSFEFYNMGKSTLGNVYVTIEGDFCLANNSEMSYIGAINGYGQEYVSPQIVPLVGGDATGTVVIHFEDSNGDEITTSSDFTAYVEGGMEGDWGDMGGMEGDWSDMGGMEGDWSDDMGGMEGDWGDMEGEWSDDMGDMEGEDDSFIFGLPLWADILIAVGIVGVVAVVVVIIVNKKKKAAFDEDDD